MQPALAAPNPAQLTDASKAAVRTKVWHHVAVRLADEGVPIRAIMRALMISYEDIREVLEVACERGMILTIPRDEWPPGTRRDERSPDTVPLEFEDTHMTMLAMRTFSLTPAEAKMFVVLLRRPEVTKGMLHTASQRDDPTGNDEPSALKIVDVFVCKLRKKLKHENIIIKTAWGKGYYISPDSKVIAFRALGVKDHEFKVGGNVVHLVEHKDVS